MNPLSDSDIIQSLLNGDLIDPSSIIVDYDEIDSDFLINGNDDESEYANDESEYATSDERDINSILCRFLAHTVDNNTHLDDTYLDNFDIELLDTERDADTDTYYIDNFDVGLLEAGSASTTPKRQQQQHLRQCLQNGAGSRQPWDPNMPSTSAAAAAAAIASSSSSSSSSLSNNPTGDSSSGGLQQSQQQQFQHQIGGGARSRRHPPRQELFEVVRRTAWHSRKFSINGMRTIFKISGPDHNVDGETWLRDLLSQLIEYFFRTYLSPIHPDDRVCMSFSNRVSGDRVIHVSMRLASQISDEVVFEEIFKFFTSAETFFIDGFLEVNFDHIRVPRGAGRITRRFGQSSADFISEKCSFVKYTNSKNEYLEDEYCLPYALVIAHSHACSKIIEGEKKTLGSYLRTFSKLRWAAENLCRRSGVSVPMGGCGLDQVVKFQNYLVGFQIIVYEISSTTPIHRDRRYDGQVKLNILLHNNHYMVMTNVQACFGKHFFCEECNKSARTRAEHFCIYTCSQCLVTPKCSATRDFVLCRDCNRYFYGPECFAHHLDPQRAGQQKKTVCEAKRCCPICYCRLSADHECGKRKCRICQKKVDKGFHLCHIPKYTTRRTADFKMLCVYFDLESRQDERLSELSIDKFKHVPNLCVLHSSCNKCFNGDRNKDDFQFCPESGEREHVFFSENCIDDLMTYLIDRTNEVKLVYDEEKKKYKNKAKWDAVVAIAHNLKGYDGHFVLKYALEKDGLPVPKLIMNGTSITEMSFGSLRFIDSLNYFQKGLAALPELSGFEGGKGYFPHFLNSVENQGYVGVLRAKKFYGYDEMTVKARHEFDKWYTSVPADYVFDFREEIIKYCRQDVTILRRACEIFQTAFFAENNIDPWLDGCTAASVVNKVFRANYLEEDAISIIPRNGYRLADNQSKVALKWLKFMEIENNIEIMHAGNSREFSHPAFGRVDGYHAGTNTIYEMDGCWWHSCEDCYPVHDSDDSYQSRLLSERRDNSLSKHRRIIEAGFNLCVKRECDFDREMKASPELFAAITLLVEGDIPLNPRDAFYGGRTEATNLYFKSDGETKMHYYDVCSLYPFVNKVGRYPEGHPQVHIGDCNDLPWQSMEGLIKATVLPPRALDPPVLPYKLHKKLLFFLCLTCAQNLSQEKCTHSSKERQMTGTWVIEELKIAVREGYEVVEIFEIWSYKTRQDDPKTKSGGFFSAFINHFLKIKVESSGYPDDCETDEDKREYIRLYYEHEGILLDPEKICDNPGLRAMAKTMLNSFWGRFGLRDDLMHTEVIKTPEMLWRKIVDPRVEVQSIIPVNDETLIMNSRTPDEAIEPAISTNVVVAAFTTAYARIELYKYLKMLGPERLYYHDTDGIMFTSKPGDKMPPLGPYLGNLTNELVKYGKTAFIDEHVAGGPKNYAMQIRSPSVDPTKPDTLTPKVTIKGITLNYSTEKQLNFEVMRSMVLRRSIETITIHRNSIRRNEVSDVYTTRVKKTYQFNFTKRKLSDVEDDEYRTYPFGY